MNDQIVFLGPEGSTFSYLAYEKLSEFFGTPKVSDKNFSLVPVVKNEEVLPALVQAKGYGVIAMETKSGGKVTEPVESFIGLLQSPIGCQMPQVVGAIKLKLNFALMARNGIKKSDIRKILAHPKAIGPCQKNIGLLGAETFASSSNGKAAEDVATRKEYSSFGALAPACAAKKFGLQVIEESFEDGEAITTFFLLAPKTCPPFTLKNNRALIVFQVEDKAGSLVQALLPFYHWGLSLIHIHSAFAGDGKYAFAIEVEVSLEEVENFSFAVQKFKKSVSDYQVFGPFGIIDS